MRARAVAGRSTRRPGGTSKKKQARAVLPSRAEVDRVAGELPELQRAFMLTAAWSGLRLFEVAALREADLTVAGPVGRLVVRRGKGGKRRESVLFEPGLSALRGVLPGGHGGLIFLDPQGMMWSRQHVHRWWRPATIPAGCEHLQFRDLRRFYATFLLDQGVADMDVAIALGHWDRQGRPNTDLVQRVYGRPDHGKALARVAQAAG